MEQPPNYTTSTSTKPNNNNNAPDMSQLVAKAQELLRLINKYSREGTGELEAAVGNKIREVATVRNQLQQVHLNVFKALSNSEFKALFPLKHEGEDPELLKWLALNASEGMHLPMSLGRNRDVTENRDEFSKQFTNKVSQAASLSQRKAQHGFSHQQFNEKSVKKTQAEQRTLSSAKWALRLGGTPIEGYAVAQSGNALLPSGKLDDHFEIVSTQATAYQSFCQEHDRANDADRKLFSHIRGKIHDQLRYQHGKTVADVTGTVAMITEITMCQSCFAVALQFMLEFRNVEVKTEHG